jgi:glutathione S-transferase
VVHHLDDSRSHRIIWLMEELGLDYEIRRYWKTDRRVAPPDLEAAHPLGKAPMLTDGPRTLIESGAIIDYVVRRHGGGRLAPPTDSPAFDDYQQWLHYAEGSAMPALTARFHAGLSGQTPGRRIEREVDRHLAYVDAALDGANWLLGETFSAADIQLSYFAEVAAFSRRLAPYRHAQAWIERCQARPAYRAAVERGGAYRYAPIADQAIQS